MSFVLFVSPASVIVRVNRRDPPTQKHQKLLFLQFKGQKFDPYHIIGNEALSIIEKPNPNSTYFEVCSTRGSIMDTLGIMRGLPSNALNGLVPLKKKIMKKVVVAVVGVLSW